MSPTQDQILAPKLSPRQRQIAELVRQAKLNKQIAFELGLSLGTVKEYLNKIYQQLGFNNRVELALWAERRRELAPAAQNAKPLK